MIAAKNIAGYADPAEASDVDFAVVTGQRICA
jgi:hypothetical protein